MAPNNRKKRDASSGATDEEPKREQRAAAQEPESPIKRLVRRRRNAFSTPYGFFSDITAPDDTSSTVEATESALAPPTDKPTSHIEQPASLDKAAPKKDAPRVQKRRHAHVGTETPRGETHADEPNASQKDTDDLHHRTRRAQAPGPPRYMIYKSRLPKDPAQVAAPDHGTKGRRIHNAPSTSQPKLHKPATEKQQDRAFIRNTSTLSNYSDTPLPQPSPSEEVEETKRVPSSAEVKQFKENLKALDVEKPFKRPKRAKAKDHSGREEARKRRGAKLVVRAACSQPGTTEDEGDPTKTADLHAIQPVLDAPPPAAIKLERASTDPPKHVWFEGVEVEKEIKTVQLSMNEESAGKTAKDEAQVGRRYNLRSRET